MFLFMWNVGKPLQIVQLVRRAALFSGAPACCVLLSRGVCGTRVVKEARHASPSLLSVPRGIHAIAGRWEGQGGAGRVRHHTTAAQHSAPKHPRACFCLIYLLQAIGDDEEELGGYVTTEEFLRLRDTSTCGKMQVSSTHKLWVREAAGTLGSRHTADADLGLPAVVGYLPCARALFHCVLQHRAQAHAALLNASAQVLVSLLDTWAAEGGNKASCWLWVCKRRARPCCCYVWRRVRAGVHRLRWQQAKAPYAWHALFWPTAGAAVLQLGAPPAHPALPAGRQGLRLPHARRLGGAAGTLVSIASTVLSMPPASSLSPSARCDQLRPCKTSWPAVAPSPVHCRTARPWWTSSTTRPPPLSSSSPATREGWA